MMESFAQLLNKTNDWIGNKVIWLSAALVLLFSYDVLMRYLFNTTRVWITEMEWHLFSLLFLLGAAYALKDDRHVRVDLFYQKFSPRKKAIVDLTGTIFLLIPWCLMVIWHSAQYALNSLHQLEGSPNPGGLPYRFVIKSAITLGFLLLLMQAFAQIIINARFLLRSSIHHKPKTAP